MKQGSLGLCMAALIGCGFGIGGSSQECLQYEPATVRLDGQLVQESRYGPPGYGDNPSRDQLVSVLFLRVDQPFSVCGDPDSELNQESFEAIELVQLIVTDIEYSGLIGESVVVRGRLSQALTGHHYTQVFLRAQEIMPK